MRESQRLAEAGDWGEHALATNRRLSELHPDATGVRLRLAACQLAARRLDEALASYEAVLAGTAQARQQRIARRRIGEIHELRRVAATGSFAVAHQRALGLRAAAKTDLALVWHERAVELARTDHERVAGLSSWAGTLRTLRRTDEALAVARRATSVDPHPRTNPAAYAAYVAALVDAHHAGEAVRHADALVDAHSRDPVVLRAAGRAYLELARQTGDDGLRRKADYCFAAASGADPEPRRYR